MTTRVAVATRDTALAVAHGVGQMLFCDSAPAGVVLLASLALVTPRAAGGALGGSLLATVVARAIGAPRFEWRQGLYGYAGALIGFFGTLLFAPIPAAVFGLSVAAALSVPLTRMLRAVMASYAPPLALPALLLLWACLPLLPRDESGPPSSLLALAGWALSLAAIAIASRVLLVTALLGVAGGAAVCLVTGVDAAAAIIGNAVPTAIVLGAVLVAWSPAAGGIALVGAAAAGALAAALGPVSWAVGIPLLVAPFNAVTLAVIAGLRCRAIRLTLRVSPLPAGLRGDAEAGAAWGAARQRLLDLVAGARRILVLTGAGVSTAAGLPDIRGAHGFWRHAPRFTLSMFVASPEARERYWQDEERFFRLVQAARPARVHRDLAELFERRRVTAIVTQNVDGLHQAAGLPASAVIELHGSILEAHCLDCAATVPRASLSSPIATRGGALYCGACQGLLKGGGVMFEEMVSPERMDAVLRALLASDALLVLGTSLTVLPASDVLRWAHDGGIPVAIVNATPTPYDRHATVALAADVGAIVHDLVGGARPERSRIGVTRAWPA